MLLSQHSLAGKGGHRRGQAMVVGSARCLYFLAQGQGSNPSWSVTSATGICRVAAAYLHRSHILSGMGNHVPLPSPSCPAAWRLMCRWEKSCRRPLTEHPPSPLFIFLVYLLGSVRSRRPYRFHRPPRARACVRVSLSAGVHTYLVYIFTGPALSPRRRVFARNLSRLDLRGKSADANMLCAVHTFAATCRCASRPTMCRPCMQTLHA